MKKGTHGTCRSYADDINAKGFKTAGGRLGQGVYFWGYTDDSMEFYVKELASSWWYYSKCSNRYKSAADTSCSVIFVEVLLENKKYLDIEDIEIKQRFILFSNEIYRRLSNRYKRDKKKILQSAYDLFVKRLEEELGSDFDVIHVRVAPPNKDYYKAALPVEITGAPSCFVVKNTSCIKILRTDSC